MGNQLLKNFWQRDNYKKDARHGKDCNCVCPECNMPLVAKNGGEIRLHHFAHSSNTKGATCFQTMIHRFAKDIFNEITEFKICDRDNRIYKINNVHLETKIQDIIPDIILETDNGIIFVEIYVTHQLDYDKK